MTKLTEAQKAKILETREAVTALQRSCDSLFSKLLEDIGFDSYAECSEMDLANHVSNPVDWVFDIVFNTEDDTAIQECFRLLEQAATNYDALNK